MRSVIGEVCTNASSMARSETKEVREMRLNLVDETSKEETKAGHDKPEEPIWVESIGAAKRLLLSQRCLACLV